MNTKNVVFNKTLQNKKNDGDIHQKMLTGFVSKKCVTSSHHHRNWCICISLHQVHIFANFINIITHFFNFVFLLKRSQIIEICPLISKVLAFVFKKLI